MSNTPTPKIVSLSSLGPQVAPEIGSLVGYVDGTYAYTGDGETSPLHVTDRICQLEAPQDPLYQKLLEHQRSTFASLDAAPMGAQQVAHLKNMIREAVYTELARVFLQQSENAHLSRDPRLCLPRGATFYANARTAELRNALSHFTSDANFEQFASLVQKSSGLYVGTGEGDEDRPDPLQYTGRIYTAGLVLPLND